MGLSNEELERNADDVYKDRRITTSVFCGTCGYNLRTLPYLYTCPECGHEYNARPMKMRGIYAPQEAEIPFGDVAAAGFCALSVVVIAWGAFNPLDAWRIAFAVIFVLFTFMFLVRAYRRFFALLHARRIAKRIAMDNE